MSLYTATATSTGRDGRAVSSDGVLDVTLAVPKELGGDGAGTNPEQMFAAGYAACFASSLQLVAKRKRIDVTGLSVTAEVGLDQADVGYALSAALRVTLPDHVSPELRQELVDRAHQVCPYSRATRGNIQVAITVA
jgi:Ohr subfamily peroxiredoxin